MRTKILWGFCLIVLAIPMVWAKAFYSSKAAYLQGMSFCKAGNDIKAITFFDRSVRWYAPLNPYVYQSAEQLWNIGEKAEKHNDIQLALMAYRTILHGFLAANSLYTPGQHWIENSNKKIEELTGPPRVPSNHLGGIKKPAGSPSSAPVSPGMPGPHRGWSFLVVIAFLGWVGSGIGFILFGLETDEGTVIRWRRGTLWCVSIAFFFAIWIIGMMKA